MQLNTTIKEYKHLVPTTSLQRDTQNQINNYTDSRVNCDTTIMGIACCYGYSTRLIFLMVCAIIEYMSHAIIFILSPMITLKYYPEISYTTIGFGTAILGGAGYLGHAISCQLWINVATRLNNSKGVILWGLAITGTSFFGLLLCQSFLAIVIVRFLTGLLSGVIPVALIEIDDVCGNRQSRMANASTYLGTLFGAAIAITIIYLNDYFLEIHEPMDSRKRFTEAYFYIFCVISMICWIAVVVILIGLRSRHQSAYVQLDEFEDGNFSTQSTHSDSNAEEEIVETKDRSSSISSICSSSSNAGASAAKSLEVVKSVIEETFGSSRPAPVNSVIKSDLLDQPNPHFDSIRQFLPHYYHGFTHDGHLIIWDFLGHLQLKDLRGGGFTTMDISEHYAFFLQFAVEHLLQRANNSTAKIVYIIDLEGLSVNDADVRSVEMLCSIAQRLQQEFPGLLYKMAVLNIPAWINSAISKVQAIVSSSTMTKVAFCTKANTTKYLIQIIGNESLPVRYGGRNAVEIGKSTQERALRDHLQRTTSSLELTKELIGKTSVSQRRNRSSSSASVRSVMTDEGSDEEAFFDCTEYGLRDPEDEIEDEEDISIVIHTTGHLYNQATSDSFKKSSPATQYHTKMPVENNAGIVNSIQYSKSNYIKHTPLYSENMSEISIIQEPYACLMLGVYFCWSLVQHSFDELFPLWVFKQNPLRLSLHVSAIPARDRMSVSDLTMLIAGNVVIVSVTMLVWQLCCCSFSGMTPRAVLRFGLLLQFPVVSMLALMELIDWQVLPFAWALVTIILVLKHISGAIALQGIMCLLDNSTAIERRLAVHRASQAVLYVALFISSAAAPALYATLGYFAEHFPMNQSLLYFIQSVGLIVLFFFSFLIPSRLNFPQLFTLGKR